MSARMMMIEQNIRIANADKGALQIKRNSEHVQFHFVSEMYRFCGVLGFVGKKRTIKRECAPSLS